MIPRLTIALQLAALLAFASCAQQQHVEPSTAAPTNSAAPWAARDNAQDLPAELELRNFRALSSTVASGGPPSQRSIAEMPELGYTTVINLRTAGETGVLEEEALVHQAGMRYIHLPVRTSGIDLAFAAEVRNALDSVDHGKVLLHCGSGGRVSAAWGLVLALDQGLSEEEAVRAAQMAGMRSSRLEARVRESLPTVD